MAKLLKYGLNSATFLKAQLDFKTIVVTMHTVWQPHVDERRAIFSTFKHERMLFKRQTPKNITFDRKALQPCLLTFVVVLLINSPGPNSVDARLLGPMSKKHALGLYRTPTTVSSIKSLVDSPANWAF